MLQVVLLWLLASQANADIAFSDMSNALPHHQYEGGWEHFVGGGVAVFDCDSDHFPDIFTAGGTAPAKLIRNHGDFAFEAAVLSDIRDVIGAYPLDLNGDAAVDLFVLRNGRNIVLLGDGNCNFTAASGSLLPSSSRWSTAFTAWWEDDDNWPVLAIGNYVDQTDPEGPFEACDDNAILRPANQQYHEHLLQPGFCPLSILASRDARNRHTLRLSNDRHYYVRGGVEQMWDIEEQRFLGEKDGWPRVSLWGMGIASRDLNGDERDEVMLTSMGDQVMQLAQQDGSYSAAPYGIGTYAQRPHVGGDGRPSTGWHAEFGDVNNDGLADLFIAKGNVDQMPGLATRDPNNLLMQRPDGTFAEKSVEAGVASMARSRGGALVDFDGDGRLDILVSNRRAPLELYRNVSDDVGNWFTVDLRQPGANVHAVGARVSVETDENRQSVQRTVGGGHAGGQLLPLHFGIGLADVARVEVVWPDGKVTTSTLSAGARHLIEKP